MQVSRDFFIRQILRMADAPFTATHFVRFLARYGVRMSKADADVLLSCHELVFPLPNGFYVTRACLFTNQYFSIRPTAREVQEGLFIPGHRCVPFVDPDVFSANVKFKYKRRKLTKKVTEFDSTTAQSFFYLFGYEYVPQYIAQDPANGSIDLVSSEYLLPPRVNLTGIDLSPLIADGFSNGDRLICRVKDWDKSEVEVTFNHKESQPLTMTKEDIERETWYPEFENCMYESFDIIGPKCSMEEQLAFVFAENLDSLCQKTCGSIEEFFNRKSKKIGFELFGVETRIWKKGQDVPAVGKWNYEDDSVPDEGRDLGHASFAGLPMYIIDALLHDQIYYKDFDPERIMTTITPDFHKFKVGRQKSVLLHLKTRHDIISRSYNRFAEFELADVRHRALELFRRVNKLVYTVDSSCSDLSVYPQQSLVILSQIFANIMHIIESAEKEPVAFSAEINEIQLSVEGMELNFEAIDEELSAIAERITRNGFTLHE